MFNWIKMNVDRDLVWRKWLQIYRVPEAINFSCELPHTETEEKKIIKIFTLTYVREQFKAYSPNVHPTSFVLDLFLFIRGGIFKAYSPNVHLT
jgi:hypothetical protein